MATTSSPYPRRDFLKRSAAALAAAATAGWAHTREGPAAGRRERVAVVGAGLAGLVAAYELAELGHDVTVLEAQRRTGGRVLTLRDPFAEGQYADAGAARIPDTHDLTARYVRLFGLPTVPFYPSGGRFLALDGRRRRETDWRGFSDRLGSSFGLQMGRPEAWSKIDGGNDRLAAAFASRLGERVLLGAAVSAVERRERDVRIVFSRAGAREDLLADRVVCAVPASVVGRIEFAPPLSDEKRRALEQTHYTPASRLFVQCRARVWEGSPARGFAVVEREAEVWPSTFHQPGARGILQTYVRGDAARRLDAMAEDGRVAAALASLEAAFPGVRAAFERGAAKCWAEDEWARGAWAHPPGAALPALQRPEGPIHFAGEHTSRWPSWMQGALESGLRAAREVGAASAAATGRG